MVVSRWVTSTSTSWEAARWRGRPANDPRPFSCELASVGAIDFSVLGRREYPLRRLLAYTLRARRPARLRSRAPSRSLATRDAACTDTLTSPTQSVTARSSEESQSFHP